MGELLKCVSVAAIVALEYIAYLNGIDGIVLGTGMGIVGAIAGVHFEPLNKLIRGK